jgi:hypothetical protein
MNLVRLIYASRFSGRVDLEDLQTILRSARRNNPRKGLTGILCYAPGLFLQCLEGPRAAVNEMYQRIVNDSRNKDVTLLVYGDIDERLFEKWDMAYVRADDLTAALLMKYGAGASFDPFAMTGAQALGFVRRLLEDKEVRFDAARQAAPAGKPAAS